MAIVHANDSNFATTVADGLVLVDFYADWCGPCKMIAPVLEQVSNEITDVKIVKVNVDQNNATAGQYGIMSIPTLLLFKNGNVVGKTMGYQPKDALKAFIEKNK